jgi:crossover junction endodeoxyribonuclease RuvC
VVLGVDPGLDGGLAVLTLGGDVQNVWIMPTIPSGKGAKREIDVPALVLAVRGVQAVYRLKLAVVEKVWARPKEGVSSAFNFGVGYGAIRAVLATLGVPYELVTPQAWQKQVIGAHSAPDAKTASVAYCTRRFPGLSLQATPRSRKAHDGLSDATCIAEYARRLALGTKETA